MLHPPILSSMTARLTRTPISRPDRLEQFQKRPQHVLHYEYVSRARFVPAYSDHDGRIGGRGSNHPIAWILRREDLGLRAESGIIDTESREPNKEAL